MTKKNLFVTDFDRTLFVERNIRDFDIQTIQSFQKNGNHFVIATGRNYIDLISDLKIYDLNPDYFILNNGAEVRDTDGNVLKLNTLKKEDYLLLICYLYENFDTGFGISRSNQKNNVCSKRGNLTQFRKTNIIDLEQAKELNDVLQLHVRVDDTYELLRLIDELKKHFPQVDYFENVVNLDIVSKGMDKAEGVLFLSHLNTYEHIYTIGDSGNDINMIRKFNGAVMASARKEILELFENRQVSVGAYLADQLK